jgi:hypothetical protein
MVQMHLQTFWYPALHIMCHCEYKRTLQILTGISVFTFDSKPDETILFLLNNFLEENEIEYQLVDCILCSITYVPQQLI